MKILNSTQTRDVDTYTIDHEPIPSIELMERAAMTITQWIVKNISKEKYIKIFVGPGNNGGDALAIARQLLYHQYHIEVFLLKISNKLSNDCEINLNRLKENNQVIFQEIVTNSDLPFINKHDILIDGLFGSGLTRKIDGFVKELVQHINKSGVQIIAIDIPSGLFSENNLGNDQDAIVKANYTLTFQMPKLAFMFPENNKFAGEWEVLPIGLNQEFIDQLESNYFLVEKEDVKDKLRKRNKFAHKGNFGHVLLVSGSYGKMGAAILAAKASLRTGSGLVTVHIPKVGYDIVQTALPEAMISLDWSDIIFSDVQNAENYTAIGVGPGIGKKQNTKRGLRKLFENSKVPMVIDADALNIISEDKDLLNLIPKNSILTPHPKEFERLAGATSDDYNRLQVQMSLAKENQLYIILKGANTSIACPDGTCYFNSTGNPGMATAGSGDVLTGIILSLLGQSYKSKDAALIGVYLHGLAGDIASELIGEESIIASDLIENLGNAYMKIKI